MTKIKKTHYAKKRRLTIPNVVEDVKEMELSHTAGWNTKWYTTLEKSLAVP